MNKRIFATLSALSLLLAAGCATTPDTPAVHKTVTTVQQPPADLEVRDKITATAIVQAVDLEKREVVLKGKGGKLHTIKVGEEARNLPQVKVGDRVVVTYYEALAVNLTKDTTGGIATRKDTVTTDRAELGQKPAGMVRQDVEVVANVTGINKKTRRVTLQGAKSAVTLKVPDDIDISKLKV
ncbi:MAG: hypothetical protein LM549_14500, partial [Candidatus Competibacter sp.]|nr:hypothetical protein [Candidatus Competibacter sp.]